MTLRASGILLHVTSLPSPFGVGDLGPEAYRFVDFLHAAGQRYWQTLPLNPTQIGLGNSPYNADSAFAGNPLLISPERLVAAGLLAAADLEAPAGDGARADYAWASAYKARLLERLIERHGDRLAVDPEFQRFCRDHADWLDDYSLFVALKTECGAGDWGRWPTVLRDRAPAALQHARARLRGSILGVQITQFLFFRQWFDLRRYCAERRVEIVGDLPIYVSYDSSDVWSHPELFKLDAARRPTHVAGVPPDAFSATGQLWGHPVYRWDVLESTGFDWWVRRMHHNCTWFDLVRLDHFRGFVAYWEVPAEHPTAMHGCWIPAPADALLRTWRGRFPALRIIAEDLGVITDDVRAVMQRFGLPGMRVLQFAFDGSLPHNPHAPHNYVTNCVAYTGTHDNNTFRGWFEGDADVAARRRLCAYVGRELRPDEVANETVRLIQMSVAGTVIVPLQDLLGLAGTARMNRPATAFGNWEWRLLSGQLGAEREALLRDQSALYGRTPNG